MTTASIAGSTVLVTGATGNVGWGIAHAAATAGAHLVLPTRTESGAEALRAEFADASVVTADIGSPGGLDALRTTIGDRLDHVAAPIGSWWRGGATVDQDRAEITSLLDTYVTTQHQLVAMTAPLLDRSGGSYTLVTGAGGEALVPGTGLLVVAVRAQYALADVLRQELTSGDLRFNELRITGRIEREPRPGVIPAKEAGDRFVAVMAGSDRSQLLSYPA